MQLRWTAKELAIIHKHYGKLQKKELQEMLIGRTWNTIRARAYIIGVAGRGRKGSNHFKTDGRDTVIYLERRDGSIVETIISTCDRDRVIAFGKWRLTVGKKRLPYAMSKTGTLLHRFILKAPRIKFVDHRDRATLNNRRRNLRLATKSQNAQNQPVENKNNKSSGYKNVVWNKSLKLWSVRFKCKGKKEFVKCSRSLEIAKRIADEVRPKYHPFWCP